MMVVLESCFIGTFIGICRALAGHRHRLMIPITYGLDPASGINLDGGVYCAIFGGSHLLHPLINAPAAPPPWSPPSTAIPGLQRDGQGNTLAIAAYASFTGGTSPRHHADGGGALLARSPLLPVGGLLPAPHGAGLSAVAALPGKRARVLKALIMALFGIMISTIGIDRSVGWTGSPSGCRILRDGFSFLLLAMATFALGEI